MKEMKSENEEIQENSQSDWKINSEFYANGIHYSDEPMQLHIVKAGWANPQMYHVLIEFGDMEQTDYYLMTEEQIRNVYGIEIKIPSISEILTENPNDMELGKKIRTINQK